jgi:hypothetical protein
MRRLVSLGLFLAVITLAGSQAWGAGPEADRQEPSPGGNAFQQALELLRAGKYEEALPLARRALEFREKRFGPEDPRTAASLQVLGNIHFGLRQFRKAIPYYQQALKIREKALGMGNLYAADTLAQLGKTYCAVGSYAQAQPLLERSLAIRKQALGSDDPKTADSLAALAELQRQMGDHAQALALANQAMHIREKALGANHPETAASLELLARIYRQQGAVDQARILGERALAIREKTQGQEHLKTAQSHLQMGTLLEAGLEHSQAEAEFKKGLRGRQGLGGLAEVHLARGQYAQALEVLSASPPNPWSPPQFKAQYHTQMGLALQGLGRRGEAASSFLAAIQAIEDLRAHTPGERTSFFQAGKISGYYKSYQDLIGLLVDMAQRNEPLPPALLNYGNGPAAAAFYFGESIKARSLLEAIAAKAAPVSGERLPSDLAVREQRLREQRAALEGKQEETFQPHRGRGREASVLEAELQAWQRQQQEFIEDLRRRAPRYAALAYPRPYKATELSLRPGEVLLAYTLAGKEGFLFRVEPGGRTQAFHLSVGQETLTGKITPMLAHFRQGEIRREDLSRFSISEAAALFRDLLEPALAGVAPGTRLIIVPDGILGAFPFEALVMQAGPEWGKSVLVGDHFLVTYCQSAAILTLNRLLGVSRASRPLFALGDCIYEKTSPRYLAFKSGQGEAGALRHSGPEKALTMSVAGAGGRLQFPPLPETRQLVMDLATLFEEKSQPPQVLLDVQATETGLHQVPLEQFRYLFFGTHGFLADTLAGVKEPTLVLSQVENQAPDNGLLTFHKVLNLKLDADLVALAACMTGVGQVTQGEGVLNFARAFQQAGARSVMTALWNIPKEESLKFFHVFYQALKNGKSKMDALKGARQTIRAKEPHPYFWSGIILHGEG